CAAAACSIQSPGPRRQKRQGLRPRRGRQRFDTRYAVAVKASSWLPAARKDEEGEPPPRPVVSRQTRAAIAGVIGSHAPAPLLFEPREAFIRHLVRRHLACCR